MVGRKAFLVFGVGAFLLLVAVFGVVLNVPLVRGSGTIYIRSDGSVDPPTANITSADNITYYFTGNNYDEIVVERSNITIDGDGYTLQGSGSFEGFYLSDINDVTIKSTNIKGFRYGIHLERAHNNTLYGNSITNNSQMGVHFVSSSDNTISENNITDNYDWGVYLWWSDYNIISGNNLSNNGGGIHSDKSSFNEASQNTITNNEWGMGSIESSNYTVSSNYIAHNSLHGILFIESSYLFLRNNSIVGSPYNFGVEYGYIHDVDTSNTVDGKPIYYLIDQANLTINPSSYPDVGYLALVLSNNITVEELELQNNWQGILLANTTNSQVINNRIADNQAGVWFERSSHNELLGNNITNNYNGVYFVWSSNNAVSGNRMVNNAGSNFYVSASNNNTILGNRIANNFIGLELWYSSGNTIYGHDITNNSYKGIYLYSSRDNTFSANNVTNNSGMYGGVYLTGASHNNTFSYNNIANNTFGIGLDTSSINVIYHNNFINNTSQASVPYRYAGVWDDGYPSGGNYWSDYTGVDVKSGPYQDQPSSDGIGDTVYVIDANNTDHFPLMNLWGVSSPLYNLTINSLPAGVTFTVDAVTRTTSWSGTYSDGASVNLLMPETYDEYVWSHWLEDGDTNRIKTVTVDKEITLTAAYTTTDSTPPVIFIVSPENKTYSVSDVPLTFTVSESISWMGYSLNGQTNVTINGNTAIVGLSDGVHTLTVYANDTGGNMGYSDTVYFTIDTVSPNIEILSPENMTYTTSSVSLSFTVDEATSWVGYSLDGQSNVTISGNTTIPNLSEETHTITVYANDTGGNMGSSNLVYFTVDTMSPHIVILSPENTTYTTSVSLAFTVNEATSWIAYSLDGHANVTISGNTTLSGLSDGVHNLLVYANDTAGNTGASEMIYFSIETQEAEPFPTLIVAVIGIVAVVGAILIFYFIRSARGKGTMRLAESADEIEPLKDPRVQENDSTEE